MKKVGSIHLPPGPRAKRLNVSEAKAKLSQALRELDDGPTIIHNRGRDVAVLITMEGYERLLAAEGTAGARTMGSFLDAVDGLKRRFGGGAGLSPERVGFVPRDPFGRRTG
jgi:prevent-host-death family protein